MTRQYKWTLAAALLLASVSVAWTVNPSSVWIKGIIYAGNNKTQLTDSSGTLQLSAATSFTSSITAFAGGGQGSATAINSDFNVVTTVATAGDSVVLPAAAQARTLVVFNQGAAALAVFPGTGDTINGGSANASVTVPVNAVAVFRGLSDSAWKTQHYAVNGSLEFTGATGANLITIPDNLASGLDIKEGSNSYIKLVTTNSSESIALSKAVTAASTVDVTGAVTMASTLGVTGAVGVTGALGVTGNITGVAAVSAGTTVTSGTGVVITTGGVTLNGTSGNNDINLVDNVASAIDFTEGANSYINIVTTNSAEKVTFGKPFRGTLSTVAAAGTNQATATAIAAGSVWVTVTAANGTTAVTLPTGSTSTCVRIMSQVVGSNLNVFGHNSDNDTINGGSADAVYAQLGGTALDYCTADGVAWFTY